MFTLNQRIEAVLLIFATLALGIFFAYNINKNKLQPTLTPNTKLLSISLPTTPPSPSPTPAPQISTTSETSSDGSIKVILKTTNHYNGTKTVTLATENETGESSPVILNETLDKDSNITIPFNTWSPDNKYFFIQKNTLENTDIKVYTAQGQPFNSDDLFLDLTGLFKLQSTGHNYKEATGWGGYNLIVFNTANQSNENGPSYWFEVPSKSIIQLSTLFL